MNFGKTRPQDNGPNILLIGDPGTGKTHSMRTLLREGIEVRAIFTEQRWKPLRKFSCADGFHLRYVPPAAQGWDAMIERADNLTTLAWDSVSKMADPNKEQFQSYLQLLRSIQNYTCDVCGESFGDVTEWDNTKALWLDGLTGLNRAAMQMVMGGAIVKTQPQWGAMQESEQSLIETLCHQTRCWFILVAHLDRQVNPVSGNEVIYPKCLGKAIAPVIGQAFDEIVQATRVADKFNWSNARADVATKPGYLAISDTLSPSFMPIVDAWKEEIRETAPPAAGSDKIAAS